MPDTVPPAPAAQRPDAVKMPLDWKPNSSHPIVSGLEIVAKAEELLGVDLTVGERAWVRNQTGFRFVTRDPHDSMFFPDGHALAKTARYFWKANADGSAFGYLKPEAKNAG